MTKLKTIDIETILKEKPYDLDTAIFYANELTKRYKKIYCVVKDNNTLNEKRNYAIIGYRHFADNIPIYILFYTTKL